MVKVVFYIPMRRGSSGKKHASTAILELERFLEELEAGGFTLHGIVNGAWKDPQTGEVTREQSFHYSVAVSADDLEKLRLFLGGRAKILFDQKAIYFEIGGEVELL